MSQKQYDETNPVALKKAELKEVQQKRLRAVLKRAYQNSAYYHRVFESIGILPDDIKSVEELSKLPFTTKEELRKHGYPAGGDFLATPFEQLVGWHMTS